MINTNKRVKRTPANTDKGTRHLLERIKNRSRTPPSSELKQVIIPVTYIEFMEGSDTLYIHSESGGTPLRIQCTGKILTGTCSAPVSHSDILVPGDIHLCLSQRDTKANNN